MKQKEYTKKKYGLSHSDKILSALKSKIGQWIAMPKLSRASGSLNVHSRISDLRNRGWTVMQKNKRNGRIVNSSYMLCEL